MSPVLLALLLACAPGHGPQEVALALTPGATHSGSLDVRDASHLDFTLALPMDVIAFDVRLDCNLADLDLYLAPGDVPCDPSSAMWYAVGEESREELVVHRLADPRLTGGPLAIRVDFPGHYAPTQNGRNLSRADFTLSVQVFAARVDAELVEGVARHDSLEPASGGFRIYSIEVPDDAPALRLDLFDVSGDLDLFARHRVRVLSQGGLTATAMNPWGAESLVITPQGSPRLRSGPWFVQVENLVDPGERASFGILASFSAEAPAGLRGLPELRVRPEAVGLARALPGVFELFCGPFGGSGTCLTDDGWILTNAHVVGLGLHAEVVVCASIEQGRPARESFRGRVVEYDQTLDLALVRIESGFRGEPIPPDYRFPAVPMGDPSALAMGDDLWLVGYPMAGGQQSRVTISVSRGIVSGFERSVLGLFIKTDAEIQGGSSGGAALDADGRIVGVPSTLVELGAGQFGFLEPLTMIPASWQAHLTRRAQR